MFSNIVIRHLLNPLSKTQKIALHTFLITLSDNMRDSVACVHFIRNLTVNFVCPPSVGDVQLLSAVEQAEMDATVALVRILQPFGFGIDPLFRAQTGHQQGHRNARPKKGQKYHTSSEHVHF